MSTENKIDTTTCWYDQQVVQEMNRFFDQHRNNPETSWHFENFKILLSRVQAPRHTLFVPELIDLGCGAGQLQDFTGTYPYTGVDMDHIIEGCLLRNYPHLRKPIGEIASYISADIVKDNISFIKNFYVVVLNGFIDVMQDPIAMLSKVLESCRAYVIIHRQEIIEKGETRSFKKPSYGGDTYHSVIKRSDFVDIVSKYDFDIVAEEKLNFFNWENGGTSFLLQKHIPNV